MIIASADEDVEQPELSYTSGGCKNYTDTLEDKSAICYNVKHYNDLCLSYESAVLLPRFLPTRNENVSLHSGLYVIVYSSFIHKCPKLEISQMSMN